MKKKKKLDKSLLEQQVLTESLMTASQINRQVRDAYVDSAASFKNPDATTKIMILEHFMTGATKYAMAMDSALHWMITRLNKCENMQQVRDLITEVREENVS